MSRSSSARSNDDSAELQISPRPTLSTLDRVAELLRAFVPERPQWKLGEISHHLGWDKATTHRFLAKLVELGFVERDRDGNFSLGTFVLDLSAQYMSASPIRQRLARIMSEVRDQTGLTTQAGFLQGGKVIIALSEEGNTLVKASASLGAHLPLHATAIGKVILAQLDEEALADHLSSDLTAFTSHTLVDRDKVIDAVKTVKTQGVATAHSELADGLQAVAVPIPRTIFGVPAGLGCSGPVALMTKGDDLERVLHGITKDIRLA